MLPIVCRCFPSFPVASRCFPLLSRLDPSLVRLIGPCLDPSLVRLSLLCLAVVSRRPTWLLGRFPLLPVASRGFPLPPVASRARSRCESMLIYASGHWSGSPHWPASGPWSGSPQLVVPCRRVLSLYVVSSLLPHFSRGFLRLPVACCFPLLLEPAFAANQC